MRPLHLDKLVVPSASDKAKPTRRPLARLARDTAGNTLAIMAAALVPMTALAGSAIDMSRLYVVKVRLQQSCDAGALAGRKFMTESDFDKDAKAKVQAAAFFKNNFADGWFNNRDAKFTPKGTTDGQVEATASAVVPMSIMNIFGAPAQKLEVSCEAILEIADVDVMFVLDTTGSMACAAADPATCNQPSQDYTREDGSPGVRQQEKSNAKIKALRKAVLDFYDALAASADPTTNIRYGFVPYSSSVNIGFDLPAGSMISDVANYQTRTIKDTNSGTPVTSSSITTAAQCSAAKGRTPATGYDSNGEAFVLDTSYNSSNSTCWESEQKLVPLYRYAQAPVDVSGYVAGNRVADPTKINGAQSRWTGCVEERDAPADQEIDLAANSRATRWKPMWADVVYRRIPNDQPVQETTAAGKDDRTSWYIRAAAFGPSFVTCGKRIARLRPLTKTQVSTYLNSADFVPHGGTYHDVGMVWAARLISPTGLFAADTAPAPNRAAPRRNIIFMTDGDMAPNQCIVGQFGYEMFDLRVTGGTQPYTNSNCVPGAGLKALHDTRFTDICRAARAIPNMTVWTIAFSAATTKSLEMVACATPGSDYFAADDVALQTAFKRIAAQIAELRLSK